MIDLKKTKPMLLKYYPRNSKSGNNEEVKTLLSLKDYAKKWRIKPGIIQRLVNKGQIPKRTDLDVPVWGDFGGELFFNPDIIPPLVKTSQYVDLWGISRSTVFLLVREGRLKVSFREELDERGYRNYFDPWTPPPLKYRTQGFKEAVKRKRKRRWGE